MTIWRLTPQIKNKVSEVQNWKKGDLTISRKESFAYAAFECQADARPEIDMINAADIELIHGTPYAWSLTQLESRPDGPWVAWIFPDSMSSEEKTEIQSKLDLGIYTALESRGWMHDRIEYWVAGPLTLVEA